MANNVRAWSTTAASNGTADSDINAAEGCPPSAVNDAERQIMAKVKNTLMGIEYLDHGYTATFATTTTFASPGDLTAIYLAGRRLKFDCSTTLYGTVRSASYVASNTTVTMVMDSSTTLSSSLSAVYVGILAPTNPSLPPNHLKFIGGTTGGSSTAYTLDLTPGVASLETGIIVAVKLHTTCGAAPTLAVNGLAATTITKNGGSSVSSGDFATGAQLLLRYDGTNWENIGTVAPAGAGSAYTIKTADYTAAAGDKILADCTNGTWTLTLPASPANTDSPITVKKIGVYALTIGLNGKNIRLSDGTVSSSNQPITGTPGQDFHFAYRGTDAGGQTNVWVY
jgi:hypothetical protein